MKTSVPRARNTDPATSHEAAAESHAFDESHKTRIMAAIRELASLRPIGATAHDIATLSGLTVVQIDRRLTELERAGRIKCLKENGKELEREGFRIWHEVDSVEHPLNEPARHPIQPLVWDRKVPNNPVLRYKQNQIVRDLVDHGQRTGFGLNEIAGRSYTNDDQTQLAQLIGYSHSGAQDLSFFDPEVSKAAFAMHADGLTEDQARLQAVRSLVNDLRASALKAFETLQDALDE